MCSAIGAIGEGVLTNRIRLCILDMSEILYSSNYNCHMVIQCFKVRHNWMVRLLTLKVLVTLFAFKSHFL